jgi:two-component system, NarL family, nitrate/nitrite response regulator NarL
MTEPDAHGRVVIVDDHMLFAQTMEFALSRQGYRASAFEMPDGTDSSQLVSRIIEDPPDVLLVDLDLGPHGDGRQLIGPAARAGVDVVVVTGTEAHSEWARAIAAGAQAIVTKSRPLAELLDAVRRVLSGETLMTHQDRDGLLTRWARHRAGHEQTWSRFDRLTMREAEVLELLIADRPTEWIAVHLDVPVAALSALVEGILGKLEVPSPAAAVGLARQIAWRVQF